MKKIGLISDTHSFLDPKVFTHFSESDEIWHAGDIGDIKIIDELNSFKPTKLIWGNIDDQLIRRSVPEIQIFEIESHKILMIHIAVLVCGHSHILKIAFDKKHNLLYLNPGAYGISGFHQIRTMLRFAIDGKEIKNVEIIESPKSQQ